MDKYDVANILEEIALFLDLLGENPFKIRAYHNAAHTIESLEEDLETLVKNERLREFPAIGEHLAEKIKTLVLTGQLPYHEHLKSSVPKGLLDLMNVPGLGRKRIKALAEAVNIKTVDDLAEACRKGLVEKIPGFGKLTQANILKGIEKLKTYNKRLLWPQAMAIAKPILAGLASLKETQQVEIAGSLRRKLETVGDLDFLVASSKPEAIMKWFTSQPWVGAILAQGRAKSSVRLKQGIQADLRVIPKEQFGFASVYFTGSKAHNIKLRQLAIEQGLSLSEYGLESRHSKTKRSSSKNKIVTEEDVYQALGLGYIPPELREDMGEIEAAQASKLPILIQDTDIKGVFHCHTTDSDGHNSLDEMVKAAQDLNWQYIGISDHSKSSFQANGMDETRLFEQIKRIHDLNASGFYSTHIFAGLECDVLTNGDLDFPASVLKELDFVIISVHRSFKMNEEDMTRRLIKAIENPYTTIVGHLTGRLLLRREPYALNIHKVIDACIANGKVIELNAQPNRLDMDWRFWHAAAKKGLKCSINPDAHSTTDLLYYQVGINMARKGWLTKSDVINTYSLNKIQTYLKKRKNS